MCNAATVRGDWKQGLGTLVEGPCTVCREVGWWVKTDVDEVITRSLVSRVDDSGTQSRRVQLSALEPETRALYEVSSLGAHEREGHHWD